jgi:integrase
LLAEKSRDVSKPTKHYGQWRIRWINEFGRRCSETYDDYKLAVYQLRQHELQVEQVRRGLSVLVLADKLFNDLADYWIANRVPQKRSGDDDKSIIRCHLRPAFGPINVRKIGVEQIDRFSVERRHLDPKTLGNLLTLLGSMLRVAVDLGWLDRVPRIRKPRVRLFTADFSYLRTDDEIRRVLEAARDQGDHVFVLYATAIYTGMREGELAGLLWADVDFERRLICVQRSFDGPTKAEDVRYVPLLDALLPILRDWRLRHPGRLVFTNRDGRMLGKSARIFQEVLHRVLDAAGLPMIERKGKRRRYIVFHGFRHTFASHWVMRGGDLFKLQKILGHKTVQMTMRYAHLQPTAFAGDLARLGDCPVTGAARVLALRSGTESELASRG